MFRSIMIIQEQVAEIRSMLLLQNANMKRMRDYIELIQQLHTTPQNYVAAVSEVVRRRSYSQAFLMVLLFLFVFVFFFLHLNKKYTINKSNV